MVAGALFLGLGTTADVTFPALAVRFPALAVRDSQTTASPEALFPSSGLTDAPSLDLAILGSEPSEENSMYDLGGASNAVPLASVDTLDDFHTLDYSAAEGDAYLATASARGFELLGNGRGWSGSLVAAGIASGILAVETSHPAAHGFRSGAPWSHSTPWSTSSVGSDDTPGNDLPADVPEPATVALFAAGIAISAALRRRLTRA